ncbi:GTP-binding protein REM 1 [Habropoda laboriosa]|uniref:GTP-binding protein REM 1 n=1 Tax=Habropoda laboriosa TaxID=597456 RepID=A0A0L7RE47_9HYME|nr:GTP-binding protein REM 1 [Habropoda laboriosa]
MATNSPGQSIHLKSPRSPRQLPQLPQIPIGGQRSPTQLSVSKSPSTPLVFEFPPEYYPETPNTNFDFEEFGRVNEPDRGEPRSPGYYVRQGCRSPKSPNPDLLHSPGRKSPIFQFCETRKNLGKTMSYPPRSSIPISPAAPTRSPSASSFGSKSPRRNSCFGLSGSKSPMSPTIVAPLNHGLSNAKHSEISLEQLNKANYKNSVGSRPTSKKGGKKSSHFNRSQGCLDEAGNSQSASKENWYERNGRNISRKSTSDLTDIEDADTEVTLLSSPRRRGSMKGGLAYLASRRGSRDSQCSNLSNVSNEDVGPLNFTAHPRARQRRTSNFLELPVPDHIRPRVHSLPEKAYNPRAGDDLYRLRAFSITHKGVVNRGDSIISRRSRSNTSVNSSRNSNVSGERSPFEGSCCSGQGVAADSLESEEIEEIPKYRVVLLGDSGVGKTALVSQFMTSEYMNTYDASLDDEFGEKTVSILLDREESEMVFIDHPHVEMSVENSLSTYDPHACIVVYSIVSRSSFQVAEEILNYLWREHYTQERSVIVVGNKSDLVRSRVITENEGKLLAASRECKFIETSSGIQHNVDELLVGVLKQIRLRESRDKKLKRQGSKGRILSKLHSSKTALSLHLAREILNKMCLNDSKSKSCENLHVL